MYARFIVVTIVSSECLELNPEYFKMWVENMKTILVKVLNVS